MFTIVQCENLKPLQWFLYDGVYDYLTVAFFFLFIDLASPLFRRVLGNPRRGLDGISS